MRKRTNIYITAGAGLAIVLSVAFTLLNGTTSTTYAFAPVIAQPTPEIFDGQFDGKKIVRTDAEWKSMLSPTEFHILREEGTERAYSGKLTDNHEKGTYHCAACGLVLFSSSAKFESGTGWPSFFQVRFKKNVKEKVDRTLGEERTEVECARCSSHLGHVFDDGPRPTGLRYCMNSVSLIFKPAQ